MRLPTVLVLGLVASCGGGHVAPAAPPFIPSAAAARAHAWDVWRTMTATASGPAWNGWARWDQVFRDGAAPGELRFRMPRTAGLPAARPPLPLSLVMFNAASVDHLRANRLTSRAAVAALASFPAFSPDAIALKLIWYPVHRTGVTRVPVWDGAPTHADTDGNAPDTWRRTVAVGDAPGAIRLDRFYHRTLASDGEVESARAASGDDSIARGDPVVLVGVHVTTKERPDWTWATLWWHDAPDAGPFAVDRPAGLPAPAGNYLLDATDAAGAPSFNPWIEARFPGGLRSNCVACHRRAVVGATDFLPVSDDTRDLAGKVQTDFVWSVALDAQ